MQEIVDRHDRVSLLRIDLLLVATLVNQLATQELRAILIVPLKLNTRAGLRVAYDNLKQLRELGARHIHRHQRVFKRQQLEYVAGAQFARGDLILTQAAGVHDCERDGLAESDFCLSAHSVGNEISEQTAANSGFRELTVERANHLTQLTDSFTVRRQHFLEVGIVRNACVNSRLTRSDRDAGLCWSGRGLTRLNRSSL